MGSSNNVLIVNGSPRQAQSSSHALGEYVRRECIKKDIDAELVTISAYLKNEALLKEFVSKVETCTMLFLIFPLYVDSLPYTVIRALEVIKKYSTPGNKEKRVIALSHSGLDANQNRVAIKICECFARELNYRFAGGLMFGNSTFLNGIPLTQLNRMTMHVQEALTMTVEALATGESVPQRAQRLISKPMVPGPMFLFKIVGNWVMKKCYKEKKFAKGMKTVHGFLKVFYS
jgi:hypothetical protein